MTGIRTYAAPRPESRIGSKDPFLTARSRMILGRATGAPEADPLADEYRRDLLAAYGIEGSGKVDGNHNGYSLLLERIAADLGPLPRLDLVLLAHARSDCDLRRSLSGTVNLVFPGDPLCFAVSDQGETAAVTALDLAGRYLRHGWARNALVVLLDQTTQVAAQAAPGAKDLAVGLLFEAGDRSAGDGWMLRAARAGVSVLPDGAAGLQSALMALDESLPSLPGGGRTVVVGPEAALRGGVPSRWPGAPGTAVVVRMVADTAPPMWLWDTAVDALAGRAGTGWERLYVVRFADGGGTWEVCVFDAAPTVRETP